MVLLSISLGIEITFMFEGVVTNVLGARIGRILALIDSTALTSLIYIYMTDR